MSIVTNDMLRAHVTGAAFHLTLGKTHIAALVHLEQVIAAEALTGEVSSWPRPAGLGNFVSGASGLIARGLVTHTVPLKADVSRVPFGEFWQITRAGRLVLDLLRESGIWQEYAVLVPAEAGAA